MEAERKLVVSHRGGYHHPFAQASGSEHLHLWQCAIILIPGRCADSVAVPFYQQHSAQSLVLLLQA
jgi:hypothetical protein